MTTGGFLLSNFIGGAIGGAIGASVGHDSDSPVLKGAVVTGLISTALGAVTIALAEPKRVGTGVSGLRQEWSLK